MTQLGRSPYASSGAAGKSCSKAPDDGALGPARSPSTHLTTTAHPDAATAPSTSPDVFTFLVCARAARGMLSPGLAAHASRTLAGGLQAGGADRLAARREARCFDGSGMGFVVGMTFLLEEMQREADGAPFIGGHVVNSADKQSTFAWHVDNHEEQENGEYIETSVLACARVAPRR